MGLGWFGGGSCLGELCFSRKKWVCRGGFKKLGFRAGQRKSSRDFKGGFKGGGELKNSKMKGFSNIP